MLGLWGGVWEGMSFWRAWPIVRRSAAVRTVLLQCIMLNGLIFGGSLLVFELLRPVFLALVEEHHLWPYRLLFDIFWGWPVYLLAMGFNTLWYQSMVTDIYTVVKSVQLPSSSLSSSSLSITRELFPFLRTCPQTIAGWADGVMRLFIVATCTWVAAFIPSLLSFLPPAVGWSVYYGYVAVLHSFHAFDYRWSTNDARDKNLMSLLDKIDFLDAHWLYFVGFGATMAAVITHLSTFAGSAVYATIFPIFVIQTIFADPTKFRHSWKPPIFRPLAALAATPIVIPYKTYRATIYLFNKCRCSKR
jgi:etoposide-induced 2.4 mRNA